MAAVKDKRHARDTSTDRPAKKAKLLDNTDDEGSDIETDQAPLKVNAEYARRFEHNKKREEQHRLEEKYGKRKALQGTLDDSEDSEEGVEEDDVAELLDEALDDQVNATLQALRSKDPRIYNNDTTFYSDLPEAHPNANRPQSEPSMTLRQYHTKVLLEERSSGENDQEVPPKTYAQEQEEIRQTLVKQVQAADSDAEDYFMVAKPKPTVPKTDRVKITLEDVEKADQDPETFLSNFMASRAWIPSKGARYKPLESDDEGEEAAADEWENSYNLYFEDAQGANEKIMTYSRDAVASTTVRRDEASGRRRAREAARAKREAEQKQKEQDLARLRKLKIEEMEHKVKRIRHVGGLSSNEFRMEEWKNILEAEWSDDQWDAEMQKRFGDAYYDESDPGSEDQDNRSRKSKTKAKKPEFEDDIDIKDLIPDFDDDDEEGGVEFILSSNEENMGDLAQNDEDDVETASATPSKKRKQERADVKFAARRERRLIEKLVDENMELETSLASKPKAPTRFGYRETSPTTFGLTPRDILLADDKQLNDFAGLKKLAAFRDPIKKKKDKKFLSKKARLRKWRQETFGDAEGPKGGFETILGDAIGDGFGPNGEASNIIEGEGKKKRRRKHKKKGGDVEA